jgi:signal transduction histidine kinase
VHKSADQLARMVDALVAAARFEAGDACRTADAHSVAAGAAAGCAGLASERGVELEVVQPAVELRVGIDADLAERILQPIVENACRYGETRVSISVRRSAS